MVDSQSLPSTNEEMIMVRKGHEVEMATIPNCDIKNALICKDGPHKAEYDGKTQMGPWAYMCAAAFDKVGVGTGVGKGQRLIQK